jgi:hypothetical protein
MILIDPGPEWLARRERKIAERIAQQDRKRIERFMRKLGLEPISCDICGASSEQHRIERCRGACE